MTKTISLNQDDIKEMISKEFGVDKNKIRFDCYKSSQDGPYYSPGSCRFEFDEEVKI